ncbi:RagB/SusD family nutrient uptake outer membrane protein [Flavobacteriaceae bacterium F08102]|nr:RagB/SusD family nutrient uptake outer membrane protein [Flavobacteriaceae bacterium F08102]
MKNIKYTYITLTVLIVMLFSACQSLDDYEPIYSLEGEIAIADESSAELALTGVYMSFLSPYGEGFPQFFILPYFLSGAGSQSIYGSYDSAESRSYIDNQPLDSETSIAKGGYASLYRLVNRANWLLQEIVDVPESQFSTPSRKNEIIAEAKGLRATANFYILRTWGQFYDLNSPYGIDLRTTPSRNAEANPRSTVAQTYALIEQDLDDAIANAPDLRAKVYVNKSYAKALKAKVLLYQGKYADAAALAQEVINTSGVDFDLAPTYNELFDNTNDAMFNSKELLYAVRGIDQLETTFMGSQWGGYITLNNTLLDLAASTVTVGGQTIAYDGDRISDNTTPHIGPGLYEPTKYSTYFTPYEMIYHLRMAEVYLIAAEAEARANNAVTPNALANLNAVRKRAGATTTGGDGFETYPSSITYTQFLEAVRIEKQIELFAEMGEEWYDLIRYDYADGGFEAGFSVSDIKPSATNPDKFILPIPEESREAGGYIVEQNPSY